MTKRINPDRPLTGAEKFRRWWEKHREQRELARPAVFHAPASVVALLDAEGCTRWIEAVAEGKEAYWAAVWRFRDQLETPLAGWFRMLDGPPVEKVIMPHLDGPTARQLARFLADEGGEEILREPIAAGKGRPTLLVRPDGAVERFRSLTAACAAAGLRQRRGRNVLGRTAPGGRLL